MLEQEFDAQVIDGQLTPADPSDDLDVEKDIYVALPFPQVGKTATPFAVTRLRPCLIFPDRA